MFVADYAQQAISKIEDKSMPVDKAKSVKWKKNLRLLPKDTGVVATVELGSLLGEPGLMHKLKDIQKMSGMEDVMADISKGLIDDFYPVIDRIGNIRIDSLTFTVAENVNNDQGWVVGLLDDEYDRQAIINTINQELADQIDLKQVANTTYFMAEDDVGFAFQDNKTFTFMARPEKNAMLLEDVQKAIDSKNQTIRLSEQLQKLIEKTSKKGSLWAYGLRVHTPFAQHTDYPGSFLGTSLADESDVAIFNIRPTPSWRINDKFSLGVSIDFASVEGTLSSTAPEAGNLLTLEGEDLTVGA